MLANTKLLILLLAAGLSTASAIERTDSGLEIIDLSDPVAAAAAAGHGCAAPGAVNGQCGRYYRSGGCNDQIGSIDPGDCEGKCYKHPAGIRSVKAIGDGTYGTNCQLFADERCGDGRELGETGNAIFVTDQRCYTPPGARKGKSFRCWFKC